MRDAVVLLINRLHSGVIDSETVLDDLPSWTSLGRPQPSVCLERTHEWPALMFCSTCVMPIATVVCLEQILPYTCDKRSAVARHGRVVQWL